MSSYLSESDEENIYIKLEEILEFYKDKEVPNNNKNFTIPTITSSQVPTAKKSRSPPKRKPKSKT